MKLISITVLATLAMSVALRADASPLTAGLQPIHRSLIRTCDCADAPAPAPDIPRTVPLMRSPSDAMALYPTLLWPLDRNPREGIIVSYYVDDDPTSATTDYEGGTWSYDTHGGTDISLEDFRAMDRGVAVRAAAAGTVVAGQADLYDRRCGPPWPDGGNFLAVQHADMTSALYYHLRTASVTTGLGEAVQPGQILGYVGSSGQSYGPHLHFETGNDLFGNYQPRDPWHGAYNTQPSLWDFQHPYAGTQPFWTGRLRVTTERAVGGNIAQVDYCRDLLEGVETPAVFGLTEPYLVVVFPLQGPAGVSHTIEVRRPNDSVFASFEQDVGQVQAGHLYYTWNWAGQVAAADSGLWSVIVSAQSATVSSSTFRVGAETVFGPRCAPPAGRSFRLLGTPQRDTLRVTPLGGTVTWALVSPPSAATLTQDSILVIGTSSDQPMRSAYFMAVATGAEARRDTAWYHIVDTSKPHGPVLSVGDVPPSANELRPARPNPSTGRAMLTFRLRSASRVRLVILDAASRRVRSLASAEFSEGEHALEWDGRDDSGTPVRAGLYFASLETNGQRTTRRMVRLSSGR